MPRVGVFYKNKEASIMKTIVFTLATPVHPGGADYTHNTTGLYAGTF